MDDATVWYFGYGSNMDRERMRARCDAEGCAILERVAGDLRGWRLTFDKRRRAPAGSAAANVVPDPSAVVEGALYRLPPRGLDLLDVHEGVSSGQYRRVAVDVSRRDTGAVVRATMYEASPGARGEGLRPERWYLGHLLAGRDLLTADYVARLESTPTFD